MKRRRGAGEQGGGGFRDGSDVVVETVSQAVGRRVESHEDLEVYRLAFSAACRIFQISKSFPREETYSLTDQIRRASRSVCTGISEAWRRRRYLAAFVNKLDEAESEAAETQTWCAFAVECGYWHSDQGRELRETYDKVIGKLVNMINDPYPWLLTGRGGRQKA